jgi:hypothetical protein
MRKPLRTAAWIVGAIVLFVSFTIIPPLWNYTSWFPKSWSARMTVDGMVAPNSRLYADIRKLRLLIVRREKGISEFYFVGHTPKGNGFVWHCDNGAFSFLPGLAFSNHIQFGKGCMAGNIGIADQDGNLIAKARHDWKSDLRIGRHSVEFNAEDGKRVRMEW